MPRRGPPAPLPVLGLKTMRQQPDDGRETDPADAQRAAAILNGRVEPASDAERRLARHGAAWQAAQQAGPPELHVDGPDPRTQPGWEEGRVSAEAILAAEAALDDTPGETTATLQPPPQLAFTADLLAAFWKSVQAAGLRGERRAAQLVYLVVTSRLLDRIVSLALKGPSAAGKSFLVEIVLGFFPSSAYYALSAMSERALAYDTEPLRHRILVLYEAAGLGSAFASYLMRSLLTEGRVSYVTVEKTKAGLRPRRIEREGPTGLLTTTTALHLHPENETRLFSLAITDTPDQTKAVLLAQARPPADVRDLQAEWQALQGWLETADHDVVIPYAETLAGLIPPVAVRLRRDFPTLLALIKAHTVLHQVTRERDSDGRIVATIDDYATVRELVADLVADAAEQAVPATVRETVAAVRTSGDEGAREVTVAQVARQLTLDKSAAWRRVRAAIERGYLRNLEEGKGRAARLVPGDPLPEDQPILPEPERLQGCSDSARDNEEDAAAPAAPHASRASQPEARHPDGAEDPQLAEWLRAPLPFPGAEGPWVQ